MQGVPAEGAVGPDMVDVEPGVEQGIGDELTMAVTVIGLGAHQGQTPCLRLRGQPRERGAALGRSKVVSEAAERRIAQRDMWRVGLRLAEAAELAACPRIGDTTTGKRARQDRAVELRMPPRAGEGADVDEQHDGVRLEQVDERLEVAVGMTDGVYDGHRRAP